MSDDETARLARAWDEAAEHYERYLVPRFAPWVTTAVSGLPDALPLGPIIVPCCGTFPELPPLAAAHPDNEIVGVDLSPVMVELAQRRAAAYPLCRAVCRDATDLASSWPGTAAAVVSVFGLQQLPDPVDAITNWVKGLRPGGWLSVLYWPPVTEVEGPFALLKAVVEEAVGGDPVPDWPEQLASAVSVAGARVVHGRLSPHEPSRRGNILVRRDRGWAASVPRPRSRSGIRRFHSEPRTSNIRRSGRGTTARLPGGSLPFGRKQRAVCVRVGDTMRQAGWVANRLQNSLSPYLLQHADNPVDWYEWAPRR